MAKHKLEDLGDGITPPTTTIPVVTKPTTELPSNTPGLVSADGEIITETKPPVPTETEVPVDENLIPVDVVEIIKSVIPDFTNITLDDIYDLLSDVDKATFDRMSEEEKLIFKVYLENEFATNTEFDEIANYVKMASDLLLDNSLMISITTDSFQALDDLQNLIVEAVGNDATFIDSKIETYVITVFIHENPEVSLNDLKLWLEFQLNPGGIVDSELVKNTMWFVENNRSLTFAAWVNAHDFSKYNRTTIGPNAEQAQMQLKFMQDTLTALRLGAKFGYKDYNVREFAQMADKIALIYDAADLYGNALLQSIYAAFRDNPGDEESAILTFISSLAKYSPGLKELFQLLDEHSVTSEAMINTVIESMLGIAPGALEKVLGRKFLGEGGMREATTPLVIIGEVLFAVLQTNDISKSYVDKVLDIWPLKSSDGVAFIPTTNGVYFYEPGTVGNNMKYFKNDWTGGINTSLMVVNALGKSKIPYAAVIALLVKNGAAILSLKDSYLYASKSTGVLSDLNYSGLVNTLAGKGSDYLTQWALDNQELIEDTVVDIITPDLPTEEPETASPPLVATASSPGGRKLDEDKLPIAPIRSVGAQRLSKMTEGLKGQ